MTNFELLRSCETPDQFFRVYEHFGCGCMQRMKGVDGKEIYKNHCLSPEYRGADGCERCKLEFWKAEYIEVGEKE